MNQSQALQTAPSKNKIIERVITKGDLAELSPADRVSYYNAVCHSLKLNPLTKPFDFLEIENKKTGQTKVVLYANKDCAAQLKTNHGVSIWKTESKIEDGCLIVTAYAKTLDGREDVDEGAVFVKGLVGESLCNARMKAVTKAKRRVTLSICGLGFLDESEIDSIPNARHAEPPEQDAVMTAGEANNLQPYLMTRNQTINLTEEAALNLSYKASGLDQWACGRSKAMLIINICKRLEGQGVAEDIWRKWLPADIQSRTELTEAQARGVFDDFTGRSQLIDVCAELANKGIDKETMRGRLPGGVQSLLDLAEDQVQPALKAFQHWLNTYNEVVEGGVVNG